MKCKRSRFCRLEKINMDLRKKNCQYRVLKVVALWLVISNLFCIHARAQKDSTVPVKDVGDILQKIFKKKPDTTKVTSKPSFVILPTLSYNPSFGFVIGAKVTGGKQFGSPENTIYSVFGLEGIYTSKGIISLKARHNLFTSGNKWNFQGDWQVSKYGVTDYGLGTGTTSIGNGSFIINEFPVKDEDSAYPVKYKNVRLYERLYRKVGRHVYLGGGLLIDIFRHIEDLQHINGKVTPHQVYSVRKGFNPEEYSLNGLLVAMQYNTREHPIRSYGGIYADVALRYNPEWLGSTKNSVQLQYDYRQYWSLSKRNPEHVIAFWHWATYTLGGTVPYLALPSTASDTYNRGGRGYTLGRFKGPSYAYFETEYRFPITANKLLSGVAFFHLQSASDAINKNIFESWESGVGTGLRILFQKRSRTTMCIDIAKGRYGAWGLFFGLNEAF